MKAAFPLMLLLLTWSMGAIQGSPAACRAIPVWVKPGAYAEYASSYAVVEVNASFYGASKLVVEEGLTLRWDVQSLQGDNATIHVLLNASAPLDLVEAVVVVEIQTRMCYGSEGALGITWFWIPSDYTPDQFLDVASLVLPPASIVGSASAGRVRTPQGLQESFHTIIEDAYFFDYPGMEYRRRDFAGSWERDTGIFAQGAGHFLMPTLAEHGIFDIDTTFWFADTNVDMGPEINPYAEIILSVAVVVAVIAAFTGALYYLVIRRRRVRRRRIGKVKHTQRRYRSGWSAR
jgi:hypothetical protein